ncbi:hypothetical protein CRENBAI_014090 [Crenichthys baileyi]|uniref:Uncharacterized protein n=1 Tax=Crenichthys baileyi TaxID=28760 RepID=A0AAV9RJT2_9TELE
MSAERAIEDLFSVCNALFKFIRKPTVAASCQGNTLKRLLEQPWTGPLATVVIHKSFQEIAEVLDQVEKTACIVSSRHRDGGIRTAVRAPTLGYKPTCGVQGAGLRKESALRLSVKFKSVAFPEVHHCYAGLVDQASPLYAFSSARIHSTVDYHARPLGGVMYAN